MKNNKLFRIVFIILTMVLLYTLILVNMQEPPVKSTWSYTKFIHEVKRGIVNKTVLNNDGSIDLETHSGDTFITYAPNDSNLMKELIDNNVDVKVPPPAEPRPFLNLFLSWLPTLLLIGIIIYSMRRQSSMIGNANGMEIGRAHV